MNTWNLISEYWRIHLGSGVVALVVGVVVAFSISPTYRAEILLASVSDPNQIPGIEALGGQLGSIAGLLGVTQLGESRVHEHIATLRSRELSTKFITENKIKSVLFKSVFDEDTGRWKNNDEPSIQDAIKRFDEAVRHISVNKQTGLITVAIDWGDPLIASRWANELVKLANSELRQQAIEYGQESIVYLNRELERTNVVGIQQAIYQLIEAQIQNIMIANVREQYAFKVIDPAGVPDVDDYISPNRPLILCVFLGIGLVFGLLLASFLDSRKAAET